MKGSSQSNKLIHWFFDCLSYYNQGIDISNYSSKNKPQKSDYEFWKAREFLKKLYIKYSDYNIKAYKPFQEYEEKVNGKIIEILDKGYTNDNKAFLITDYTKDVNIKELQMLLMKLEGTFSLALKLISKEEQNKIIKLYYDYFMDNSIPMWVEMHEHFKKNDIQHFVYHCLKNKKCVISGEPAQLAHKHAVGSSGYKNDKLIGNSFLPLAPQFHLGIDHGVGGGRDKLNKLLIENHISFEEKGITKAYWYKIKGDEEAKFIKKYYKNHGRAYKEGKHEDKQPCI